MGFIIQLVMKSRLRLVAFALSLAALMALLLFLRAYSSPQMLVPASEDQTGSHHKVSVVLCHPHVSFQYLKSVVKPIQEELLNMKVEHEVLFITPRVSHLNMAVRALFPARSHYELVPLSNTCTESIVTALDRAHYSIIMVLGTNLTSYHDSIPKLIKPLLGGKSDLVLANEVESSGIWCNILTFLLTPITGTSHVLDALTFAVSSSTWTHGCPHDGHGSLPIDMLSRCSFKHNEIISVSGKRGTEESLSLSQVAFLWWAVHPLISLSIVVTTFALTVVVIYYMRLLHSKRLHSSAMVILCL